MSALLKNSKLPPEEQAIARRLREERKLEKFSQAELAVDAGLGRASLSHYEYGITALPFGAGIKLCRRLDLNQRWLATGREPKRPYVPLNEIDLQPEHEDLYDRSFLEGYRELMKDDLHRWVKEHPPEVLINAQIRGGPAKVFARKSRIDLERFIRETSARLREEKCDRMKLVILADIQAAATELQRRLESSAVRQ